MLKTHKINFAINEIMIFFALSSLAYSIAVTSEAKIQNTPKAKALRSRFNPIFQPRWWSDGISAFGGFQLYAPIINIFALTNSYNGGLSLPSANDNTLLHPILEQAKASIEAGRTALLFLRGAFSFLLSLFCSKTSFLSFFFSFKMFTINT